MAVLESVQKPGEQHRSRVNAERARGIPVTPVAEMLPLRTAQLRKWKLQHLSQTFELSQAEFLIVSQIGAV